MVTSLPFDRVELDLWICDFGRGSHFQFQMIGSIFFKHGACASNKAMIGRRLTLHSLTHTIAVDFSSWPRHMLKLTVVSI